LGIIILQALVAQFAEKIIVFTESNEKAFDAAIRCGALEIRGHVLCIVLEFKIFLLFI
jgi:hypothetical protein